jgi:integral membrane protein
VARLLRDPLFRYRVLAYVVGTGLVVLVCIAVPLHYAAGAPWLLVQVVGGLHGWLFIVYLLSTLDLWYRYRWNIGWQALIMGAGTIPFCSFIAEHFVTRYVRSRAPEPLRTVARS